MTRQNQIIIWLDDYEMTLDLVIKASYDSIDRMMDDMEVYVRSDGGEVLVTNIFTEERLSEFTEMLFDELYNQGAE